MFLEQCDRIRPYANVIFVWNLNSYLLEFFSSFFMHILTPISVASSRGSPDGLKLSGAGTVCPTAYETLSGGNVIQYPYIHIIPV